MPLLVWGVPVIAEVEDILTLVRVDVQNAGLQLLKDIRTAGNDNVMITCPMHKDGQERKPSCGVSKRDVRRGNDLVPAGTVHCFTCGFTADLPGFVSSIFGYNDDGMYGYKWIVSRFASVTIERRGDIKLDLGRGNAGVDTSPYISEEVMAGYRYTHAYMYERGLTDTLIQAFDIGYDKENDAITFPVCDAEGNVITIQRRSVSGKQFLNNESEKGKALFGLQMVYRYLHKIERVWVVESPIDALTLWKYKQAAVATLGTEFTPEQTHLLRVLPVRQVVLAQDNDKPGKKAKAKMHKVLGNTKMVYAIQFPEGVKDINEMTEQQFMSCKVGIYLPEKI